MVWVATGYSGDAGKDDTFSRWGIPCQRDGNNHARYVDKKGVCTCGIIVILSVYRHAHR